MSHALTINELCFQLDRGQKLTGAIWSRNIVLPRKISWVIKALGEFCLGLAQDTGNDSRYNHPKMASGNGLWKWSIRRYNDPAKLWEGVGSWTRPSNAGLD
jgi:hypothetical protein